MTDKHPIPWRVEPDGPHYFNIVDANGLGVVVGSGEECGAIIQTT